MYVMQFFSNFFPLRYQLAQVFIKILINLLISAVYFVIKLILHRYLKNTYQIFFIIKIYFKNIFDPS
jgi:hypothetical protein